MKSHRLLEVLADLPTALLEDFDLEDVMSRLGDDIADVLDVAGAGVMLEDGSGVLRFVSASDPVLHALERLQVEYDEGPCLHAYRQGDPVHATDLREDERFPRFAAQAVGVGMGSVFSFPLRNGDGVIGALNLYDRECHSLSAEETEAAMTLARVATAYLLNARDISRFRSENAHLTRALERRVLVEQAKGYLRATADLAPDAAWELLRQYARSRQLRAVDVARQLLDGELAATDLQVAVGP